MTKMTVWEFVETYYKNYHCSADTDEAVRLTNLIEELSTGKRLNDLSDMSYNEFEKHNFNLDKVNARYNELHTKIYEKAIFNFLEENTHDMPFILLSNKFKIVQR